MKKVITILSICWMLFIIGFNSKQFVEASIVEKDEQGIEYTLNEQTNEYRVKGYTGNPTSIVILDTFKGKSVTSIEDFAFFGCSSLTNITIPNSVTSIGGWGFSNCSNLTSIVIPESVTNIEGNAFDGCSSLASIEIPNSVTSIGSWAFNRCSNLTSIVVKKGNPIYDSRENCNAIIETSTNTLIAGCQNTVISNNVTSIGDQAFSGCSSLVSITIPNSVTSIGSLAFNGCSNLTSIVVKKDNPKYDSRNNCNAIIETSTNELIVGCQNTVIPNSVTSIRIGAFYNCSSLTSITIPNGVTSIGSFAFYNCSSLASVEIPNSVTSIGSRAFNGCSNLTSIVVEKGNPIYDSRENCNAIIETSTNTLIVGCQNTTIPNSVTSIGEAAFNGCSSLTSIEIPSSVTSIEDSAFSYCSNLTSITIPNSVTSIANDAFSECSFIYEIHNNSSLNFEIGSDSYGNIAKNAKVIYNKDGTKTYKDNKEVSFIESEDQFKFMYEDGVYKLIAYLGNEETIILPKDINGNIYEIDKIRGYVRNVIIPEGITSIGSSAFDNCSSLTSITIPNSVTSIGSFAFSHCSSLTSITIPNSVTSIGSFAFSHCSSLTSMVIPKGVTSIYAGAFSDCTNLADIIIINDKIDLSVFSSNATFEVDPIHYDYYKEKYPTLNIQKAEFILPSLNIEEYITSYTVSPIKGTYEVDKVLLDGVEVSLNEVIDSKYKDELHTITIIDIVGLQNEYAFTIDTTNPVINNIENNEYYNQKIIDITEPNLDKILLNNQEITNGYQVIDEGIYTLEVIDKANNRSSLTFTIDTTNPVISNIENNKYYNQTVTIDITESNLEKILLNSQEVQNGYEIKDEGTYTLEAIDKAKNKVSVTFVIDKEAPYIKEGYKPFESGYYNEILNLQILDNLQDIMNKSIEEVIEKIELTNRKTNKTTPITDFHNGIQISEGGEYILEVTDLAKNIIKIEFTIDFEPPTIQAVTNKEEVVKENKYYNCEFIKLQFSDNIGIKYVDGIIQNGLEAECKNEGKYECKVKDIAGNETTFIFYIDRTNPKITSPNENETNEEIRVNFEDENEIDYAVLINTLTKEEKKVANGDVVNKDGSYTLEVKDIAGNKTTRNFQIVTSKPVIELLTDTEQIENYYQKVQIKVTSKKKIDTITLDGKPILNNKIVEEEGTHIVVAKDEDGKRAEKSFTIFIKPSIDITKDKKGNIIINNINKTCDVTIMKDKEVYKKLKGVKEIEELLRENGTYEIIIEDTYGNEERYNTDLVISKQINTQSIVISSICIIGLLGFIILFKERKQF